MKKNGFNVTGELKAKIAAKLELDESCSFMGALWEVMGNDFIHNGTEHTHISRDLHKKEARISCAKSLITRLRNNVFRDFILTEIKSAELSPNDKEAIASALGVANESKLVQDVFDIAQNELRILVASFALVLSSDMKSVSHFHRLEGFSISETIKETAFDTRFLSTLRSSSLPLKMMLNHPPFMGVLRKDSEVPVLRTLTVVAPSTGHRSCERYSPFLRLDTNLTQSIDVAKDVLSYVERSGMTAVRFVTALVETIPPRMMFGGHEGYPAGMHLRRMAGAANVQAEAMLPTIVFSNY